jgi:hypothetical protein
MTPSALLLWTLVLHAARLLHRIDYRTRAHQHGCLRGAEMTGGYRR